MRIRAEKVQLPGERSTAITIRDQHGRFLATLVMRSWAAVQPSAQLEVNEHAVADEIVEAINEEREA
jgi:hypothetical protein